MCISKHPASIQFPAAYIFIGMRLCITHRELRVLPRFWYIGRSALPLKLCCCSATELQTLIQAKLHSTHTDAYQTYWTKLPCRICDMIFFYFLFLFSEVKKQCKKQTSFNLFFSLSLSPLVLQYDILMNKYSITFREYRMF